MNLKNSLRVKYAALPREVRVSVLPPDHPLLLLSPPLVTPILLLYLQGHSSYSYVFQIYV